MSLRHVDINILDATNLYLHSEDMDVQYEIQADDYHTHTLTLSSQTLRSCRRHNSLFFSPRNPQPRLQLMIILIIN